MAGEAVRTSSQLAGNFASLSLKSRFALRRSYDLLTCREILGNRRRDQLIKSQTLKVGEHAELGSDLAVASFVLRMRGRVKCLEGKWIDDRWKLPRNYSDSFKLTAIELTQTSLVTEGIDNFVGLDRLQSLKLSENHLLDDFACDQLARQFRNSATLEDINISNIPFITVYGLEALLRIPSLRKISATGTHASKFQDIDLFVLAAQDECSCQVMVHDNGRQFKSQDLEDTFREVTPLLESNTVGQEEKLEAG